MRTRPIPILVRGDKFYLVDHHHLARGLYEALHGKLGKDLCVYVKFLGNGSSLEELYFWKTMQQGNWVYLFDKSGGGPQAPVTLPTHIKDLGFDSYLSLAWIVRERTDWGGLLDPEAVENLPPMEEERETWRSPDW